jgi:hypothetical protein
MKFILVFLVFLIATNKAVALKDNNIQVLYENIILNKYEELDALLSRESFTGEQKEIIRNTLFQYSYIQSQLKLSIVYDKYFLIPDYSDFSTLFYNKFCVNQFYLKEEDKKFLDWLWEGKVQPALQVSGELEVFLNDCLDVALDQSNYEVVRWLGIYIKSNPNFGFSTENSQRVRNSVEFLLKILDVTKSKNKH